jgi:hypothetical protein
MTVVFGKALASPAKNPAVENKVGKPVGATHPAGVPANRPVILPQLTADTFHKQEPQFGKRKSSQARREDKAFVGKTLLHGAGYGSQHYLGDKSYGEELVMRSERGWNKGWQLLLGGRRHVGPIEYAYNGGNSTKRR